MKSLTLLATILPIYRCEGGKRVSHRLHLDWTGASWSASWLLVPWASGWGQGTPGLLLAPALPAGMKAWWKTAAVLGRTRGKTLFHNLCARLLKRECAVGTSCESQSNLKAPSVVWFRVRCGRDWIGWLEQEFWMREGLSQKQEAKQEECSLEKINVLLLPFPVASLQKQH